LYLNGGFTLSSGGFVQYNNNAGFRNFFVATGAAEPLYLGTENTIRVTIQPTTGNVGIGTTTPSQKLDVYGNVNVSGPAGSGNIYVSGTINAKYQDVAEWVPSTQQLVVGTVVVLDQTK